jgi:hypothetical protein
VNLIRSELRNRPGATIPLVAVSLVLIIGCAAIAIDIGMLLNTRSESQRGADAAALAGAAAIIDHKPPNDSLIMVQEAIRWAGLNDMLSTSISPDEVISVELLRSDAKVRVIVQRPEVSTWFAGIWGIRSAAVGARSAARIYGSGTANCLKPFAFPDSAYDAAEKDYGREVVVYRTKDDEFMLIGFGGGQPGLGNLQPDIALPCNDRMARISVNDLAWVAPDDTRLGMVRNGFQALLDSDNMTYNSDNDTFWRNGEQVLDWRSSPRVGNVALFDPKNIGTGTEKVKIVNFATVFFTRRVDGAGTTTIYGRLFPIIGQADNCMVTNTCAPNAYRLRLVDYW